MNEYNGINNWINSLINKGGMVAAWAKTRVGYTARYLEISATTMPKGPRIESRPAEAATCQQSMSAALYRMNLQKICKTYQCNKHVPWEIKTLRASNLKKSWVITSIEYMKSSLTLAGIEPGPSRTGVRYSDHSTKTLTLKDRRSISWPSGLTHLYYQL